MKPDTWSLLLMKFKLQLNLMNFCFDYWAIIIPLNNTFSKNYVIEIRLNYIVDIGGKSSQPVGAMFRVQRRTS